MQGGLSKETMVSSSSSVWEKAAPTTLAMLSDNSVPLCMSLVPFDKLPQHWSSEQVSPSKSVCPLRGHLGLQKLTGSLSYNLPSVFHSQKLWGHLFLVLELWDGGPGFSVGDLHP